MPFVQVPGPGSFAASGSSDLQIGSVAAPQPIALHPPAGAPALERLNHFSGRTLGEEEFDLRQNYAEARFRPLVGLVRYGIVRGLDARVDRDADAGTAVTVAPGLGIAGDGRVVGLYRAITQTWSELIAELRAQQPPGASVRGIYYVVLSRSEAVADLSQDIDACRRYDLDPRRDTRLETVGRLGLRRLLVSDADIDDRTRHENLVAAMHADGSFLAHISRAVPVALVAFDGNGQPRWFSEVAGRYLAEPHGGHQVLLRQTNAAFERAVAAAPVAPGDEAGLIAHLVATLTLDYLPAAGQLPIELLRNRASTQPSIDWLPAHIRADLIPVARDEVAAIIARHLPRRVVDLRQAAAGEHLRLILAVQNAHYRRDLLDIPAPDVPLEEALFRNYIKAHDAWRGWLGQFRDLYHLPTNVALDADTVSALDLPAELAPPLTPNRFYGSLISAAAREIGDTNVNPYRRGTPRGPRFYQDWLAAATPLPAPTRPGLVVRYQLETEALGRLDNRIRALRARVEKTRDYQLLQRQQLDSQTVSLSALAGGVAGDGAGLQVARWLPFTEMKASTPESPEAPEPQANARIEPATAGNALAGGGRIAEGRSNASLTGALGVNLQIAGAAARGDAGQAPINYLQSNALQLSAFGFGLDRTRLDRLADAPRQAVTNPAFIARAQTFGVINHIRPEIHEYTAAYRGMDNLLTTLDSLFDTNEAASLKRSLRKEGSPRDPTTIKQVAEQYEALFEAGQVLTRRIAVIEERYANLEALLESYLRQRVLKENLLDKLQALIRRGMDKLSLLDRGRVENLGDFGLAQGLVDEDWRDVYARDQERTRVLENEIAGLYYVRVRDAAVSKALADPLQLQSATDSDLVPGCGADDQAELPEELTTFFDALLEVPLDDWARLQPFKNLLPQRPRLLYAYDVRVSRHQHRRKRAPRQNTSGDRLRLVRQSNEVVLQAFGSMSLPSTNLSLKRYNDEVARVFSLEDLFTVSSGVLRREAGIQRDRLELALSCMLDRLAEMPPAVRLQWGDLAEDDRLPVDDISRWPGLENAERAGFIATRTLVELIRWWFAQLSAAPSDASRTAMRNAIRAAVLFAALGDPANLVRGSVRVPPRVFDVGASVRLKLDRVVNPGTQLRLMDARQRVVGVLNVEDHDDGGTLAAVVQVSDRAATVDQTFSVIGGSRAGASSWAMPGSAATVTGLPR